jgi:hypothetical protein
VRVSGATTRWQNELGPVAFRRRWAPPVAVVESPPVLQHGMKEGKLRSGLLDGKHGEDVTHREGEKHGSMWWQQSSESKNDSSSSSSEDDVSKIVRSSSELHTSSSCLGGIPV